MSQSTNPFSGFPAGEAALEQRTSVLAILSLVFGILCVPGFGVLGALLGIIALIVIGNSSGRLSGRGLAIAGLVISLLASVIWTAIGIGGYQVAKTITGAISKPATTIMTSAQSGDYATARGELSGAAQAAITDDDFKQWVAAFQADVGAFKSVPNGMWEFFASYGNIGPLMQKFQQGSGDVIPVPAEFEKGWALIVFQVDNRGGTQNKIPVMNVGVFGASGNKYWLYNAPATTPPAPGEAPPASAEGEKPSPPPEPAPAEPEQPKTP